jgi:hypothetical protein
VASKPKKLKHEKKTIKGKEPVRKAVPNPEVEEIETRGTYLREAVAEYSDNIGEGEEMLCADGFEAAILGVTESCEPVVVYDWNECVRILQVRDEMTEEDAIEHMSFNVTGAYVGPRTPLFIRRIE